MPGPETDDLSPRIADRTDQTRGESSIGKQFRGFNFLGGKGLLQLRAEQVQIGGQAEGKPGAVLTAESLPCEEVFRCTGLQARLPWVQQELVRTEIEDFQKALHAILLRQPLLLLGAGIGPGRQGNAGQRGGFLQHGSILSASGSGKMPAIEEGQR